MKSSRCMRCVIVILFAWWSAATVSAAQIVNLTASESGLHRVSYEQLLNQGVDLRGVRHNRLSITHGSTPVAVFSKGQTSNNKKQRRYFGPGGYIEFIADIPASLYSSQSAYTLNISKKKRRNFPKIQSAKLDNSLGFQRSYLAQVVLEKNNYYDFLSPSKTDPWHYGRVIATGGAIGKEHTFSIDKLVSGPQSMSVEVYGIIDFDGPGNDHDVSFVVNGISAGGQQFDGNVSHQITLPEKDQSSLSLVEGNNTLRMDLNGIEGMPFDAVALNRAVIEFSRATVASDDHLQGQFGVGQHQLSGFTRRDIQLYAKAASGQWRRLTKARRFGSEITGFRARFSLESPAEIIAVTGDGRLTPDVAMIEDVQDIKNGQAEYLIIAHPDFIGTELQAFADYRSATSGLSSKIVDVTQVYQQFGVSVPSAESIQQYVAYAAAHLRTKYLLLVGGDQYDYKNYVSNAISHIPTLYSVTPGGKLLIQQNPVDSLYGDIDGDRIPDIPVGRFPVRALSELSGVIEKVIDYETGQGYQQLAVVAADVDDNGNGVSFEQEAESLIGLMPSVWQNSVVRAYPQSSDASQAKNLLFDGFNSGSRLISYVGHSAEQVWSRSTPPLMSAIEAGDLNNVDKPTVVSQWGCWNTYFVKPESNSMSQAFLLNANGGAAAILGASSLTLLSSEKALSEALMPKLLTLGTTIGQAVIAAKKELAMTSPGATDVILGWQILGDPAIVINRDLSITR